MKLGAVFAAGVVAGIAIVVACQNAGRHANASPADCATWQYATGVPSTSSTVTYVDASGTTRGYSMYEISGWEPFAVNISSDVYLRRCKP